VLQVLDQELLVEFVGEDVVEFAEDARTDRGFGFEGVAELEGED
jgi:hypothetical protein